MDISEPNKLWARQLIPPAKEFPPNTLEDVPHTKEFKVETWLKLPMAATDSERIIGAYFVGIALG